MNFYLADVHGCYNSKEDNAYIPDFFVDEIYELRNEIDFSIDLLYSIDPYEDVIIDDISTLEQEVDYLINIANHTAFMKYPYMINELIKLKEYITIAKRDGKTVVSVGD